MAEQVELYCTQNDEGQWLVWFSHPLGGMNVLVIFDNETDASAFRQDQIDSADFS
jgi:hypothetical protein